MSLSIRQGAAPFFLISKADQPIGCLCLHGLTASPFEMQWLGEYLAAHGAMVYGPRLFGHGVDPTLMQRARWQDWYLSALDGYHLLRRYCDQVYVLGLSMGGVTSLYLASQVPVAGVVAMAPAFRVFGKNLWRAHLLRMVRMTFGKSDPTADPLHEYVLTEQRRRGQPEIGRISYYEHSAAGISELLRFQRTLEPELSKITAPTLLIFAEHDDAVPLSTLAVLKSKLTNARRVETLTLAQGGHVITNDVEHQTAYDAARRFIEANQANH